MNGAGDCRVQGWRRVYVAELINPQFSETRNARCLPPLSLSLDSRSRNSITHFLSPSFGRFLNYSPAVSSLGLTVSTSGGKLSLNRDSLESLSIEDVCCAFGWHFSSSKCEGLCLGFLIFRIIEIWASVLINIPTIPLFICRYSFEKIYMDLSLRKSLNRSL